MSETVRHNPSHSRFELDLGDGEMAIAVYRPLGEGVIALTHTEVPWRGRQRGTGSRLISGALELVREHKLKVVARCSFVRDYLARHPEFSDLVAG